MPLMTVTVMQNLYIPRTLCIFRYPYKMAQNEHANKGITYEM